MSLSFEFFLARKFLGSGNLRGATRAILVFAIVGMILGNATLIIVSSIMTGFHDRVMSNIVAMNGDITVYNYGNKISQYMSLSKRIGKIHNVTSATPMILHQALAMSGEEMKGVLVKGVSVDALLPRRVTIALKNNRISVGVRLAEHLGVSVDDEIKLIIPSFTHTFFGSIPQMKTYKIGSVFTADSYEYDNGVIYMPLKGAQRLFNIKHKVNEIEIRLDDQMHIDDVSRKIRALNGFFHIRSWREVNKSLFEAINIEKYAMMLAISLMVLVAAFNIVSLLLILVHNKESTIAILRAMGVSDGAIIRIFVYIGCFIGFLGTSLGAILGILFLQYIENIRSFIEGVFHIRIFDRAIYFLSKIPVTLDYCTVLEIVVTSLIICIVMSALASKHIARIDPGLVLRRY